MSPGIYTWYSTSEAFLLNGSFVLFVEFWWQAAAQAARLAAEEEARLAEEEEAILLAGTYAPFARLSRLGL